MPPLISFSSKVVPPDQLRYRTQGDWRVLDGHVEITVADTGNDQYNFLLALHELIEAHLCHWHGITTEQVDAFDFQSTSNDPGLDPKAIYHREHMVAFAHEIQLCAALGIDWIKYNDVLDATWEKIPEKPIAELSHP